MLFQLAITRGVQWCAAWPLYCAAWGGKLHAVEELGRLFAIGDRHFPDWNNCSSPPRQSNPPSRANHGERGGDTSARNALLQTLPRTTPAREAHSAHSPPALSLSLLADAVEPLPGSLRHPGTSVTAQTCTTGMPLSSAAAGNAALGQTSSNDSSSLAAAPSRFSLPFLAVCCLSPCSSDVRVRTCARRSRSRARA